MSSTVCCHTINNNFKNKLIVYYYLLYISEIHFLYLNHLKGNKWMFIIKAQTNKLVQNELSKYF